MAKAKPIADDIGEDDFPEFASKEDRVKALTLIGISKKDARDDSKSLVDKLNIEQDTSAMLGEGKKKTLAERVRTLFQQENFSPMTKIVRLVKIEEAKMEAWNRAEACGLNPTMLACLPRPDKKFYATLLLQLVKYEVPEYKSVEISGQVDAGMTVLVVNSPPQQKVIRVDAGAPDSIKKMFGQTTAETLTIKDKKTAIEVVDDDY